MPDLIAQGPLSENRWRRELPAPTSGTDVLIGRSDADWNVPWDGMISRSHVRLTPIADDRVEVQCAVNARNSVFFRGNKSVQFTLVPGEHFVIGGTTFTLANRPGASDSTGDTDLTEHAFDHVMLRRRNFRDAAARIEMLSRLPDLITSSSGDEELLVRVTSVLLQATPSASAVAIASADSAMDESGHVIGPVNILHYDSRVPDKDGPAVSARLVRKAIERRESVLHLWSAASSEMNAFTASEEADWAFCVPLRSEACTGWALYVTGQLLPDESGGLERSLQAAPENLGDDVKFAELVGTMISNLRQSRRLERRQAAMRRFFAPVVMEALAGRATNEVLAPREANLSVMFCDLRGFTKRSERDADQLLELLARVSDALGIMTRHILDTDGVIGDFHGDAAMGFWGWPFEQRDAAIRAAETASRIVTDSTRALETATFRFGIGIATGRAVAGQIGTVDQVKVTAFGPVVNLASRLEGLTKVFGAKVIIDMDTARALQESGDHGYQLRRLARVRPAGLEKEIEAWELLEPPSPGVQVLSPDQIASYEASLDALINGDWSDAYDRLHAIPAWDRPKDVLLSIILKNNRIPPDDWDGVINMPKL
ncbi:MAG: adenylate/guanylate cyclase domain-containing protein [Rubripirellula sp.]|nr:adenylate/guanylate cyclase domain-containing protein [Rubripirellula sp.]